MASEGDSQMMATAVAEVSSFSAFLDKVVSVFFEDEGSDNFDQTLKEKSSGECMKKFLSDPQIQALFVQKAAVVKEENDGEGDDKEVYTYAISIEVRYTHPRTSSVVFLKKVPVVEADKSFSSQLRWMTFSEGSPYETLHSYISGAMAPFFKSFIRALGKADRDGDKMATSVEKKIEELGLGLLHLQQNIDIPEISLTVHPYVAQVIKKCAEEKRKPKVSDFGDKIEDATFLNALHSCVNRWTAEIRKVTKIDRDVSSGTALQEISFWLTLERALLNIQEMREKLEVTLTLDILKAGKRFHATVGFDNDTGLKEAMAKVNDYNPLMKDFPLTDLLSATELGRIKTALIGIFNHLKKIRNTKYPIMRCLRLVEAISKDLSCQLLKVLGTRRFMHIMFDDFEKLLASCFGIFQTWDDEYEKLQSHLREIAKKKKEENMKMIWKINLSHKKLQTRLEQIKKFRRQHEQLRQVIVRVLRPAIGVPQNPQQPASETPETHFEGVDFNSIEEVNLAYDNVKGVDCLDVSAEGTLAWEAANKRYNERIDRVEATITSKLRDQLVTAKDANEMFRIFSRFNALFVRPHIRGAIREYQTQLIQRVKDDIESLHEKFKTGYRNSTSSKMSRVRDLPPVAGSIMWAKQIERQLNTYMHRVEDVLGKGWESYMDGQKLKADGDSFRLKLNAQPLFDDWVNKVTNKQVPSSGRIFQIDSVRSTNRGNVFRLKVNFSPDIITLSKEVRNLKSMGFRIPLTIVNKAHAVNVLYPSAISLHESLNSYDKSCDKITEKPSISLLVAGMKKDIQNMVLEGGALTWESYKLEPFVHRMSESTFQFQEKVDDLLVVVEQIDLEIRALETCHFMHVTFADILAKIQKHVDDLSLNQYSNLPQWVARLDQEVELRLATRLEAGLKAWTHMLENESTDDPQEASMDTDQPLGVKAGGEPKLKQFIHELRITNQVMYLSPPVEEARCNILGDLFMWESTVLTLPRITHARYQVGLNAASESETHYKNLLAKLPSGQDALIGAYEAIEKIIKEVHAYVTIWFDYQALWDLQADFLFGKLGSDTTKWMKALEDIKASRKTFDTSETSKEFGPLKIDFGKVQSKVSIKYDSWHKEVLSRFGSMLGGDMQEFFGQISKSRTELEQQSIETANTSEAVGFITYVQSLKKKMKDWEKQVDSYKEGQRILERQRFQFPNTWLYSDNIEGEWGAFSDILKRKDSSIQTQVASLQMKIVSEDKVVESKTTDILAEWEHEKPVEGNVKPEEALRTLTIFEGKFTRLKEERDNISKAKEALELSEPGQLSVSDQKMMVTAEELQDLKDVWSELSGLWKEIDEMKEKPWLSVQPRKIRTTLDDLKVKLKDLPARMKSYPSYEYIKGVIQSLTKVNVLVVELKAESVKERHWKQLMKKLRVSWSLSELTLGHIWEVDLIKNEAGIREVLLVAQGEMALEEFLKQVSEVWKTYDLELINYQNKCKLIRGWDDLFTKVKEHINSVAAMKLSPYYKEFEDDALSWEDKLNRINGLFDVWIDVQRRWVYLEGIFTGSADIKHLLPVETSKFQGVCTEFLGLMKKVSKSPLVMDVLNIPNVQKQLERLADLLSKIQKALGEYLERERSSFPRFYFVGDEDLLEIIGNSKNVPRLQKHFKKMFAGVYAIILEEEDTLITGISSKEGEEVKFCTPVSLKDKKINEWLTGVEQEMRMSLAKLLAQAVNEMGSFRGTDINQTEYLNWVDKYQAQLVVLAAQISWSEIMEKALQSMEGKPLTGEPATQKVLDVMEATLNVLADSVLHEQPPVRRKKLEHLITELVHQRDVTRVIVKNKVCSSQSFDWLAQMRFYFDPKNQDVLQQLSIHMANAKFNYGFEYLGVQEKLVQTPLTDRCYLCMTQALEARLGGSPFGPAGTGKTESVKSLGNQLGRFVLVFNCDETFDFQAMGRIFVGLCQVGAWGCFDEFNRLEERMLSAVSQQIQTIQEALKENASAGKGASQIQVELVGKQVKVNSDMAIFITMNPGYAGRSNLPDNLKKLFRSLAMTMPDRQLISQVMLYSQGFRTAEKLADKIVPFFKLCFEQLSPQSHYDFGLRALKSVLVSAGNVKRDRILKIKQDLQSRNEEINESSIAKELPEQEILIQSIMETMVPKLVAEDIPLLYSLLSDVFPGVTYAPARMERLKEELRKVCDEMYFLYGGAEGEEGIGWRWMEKVLQLYQITNIHHGLMMVGPSGSGKSTAWKVLLKALERIEGVEGVSHVIDPKSISKDALYGSMDPNTREWTDGLFTHILRKIIDNVRGESGKRQWIIFDGDVDPEWVENLNSVLDDNKLLTLPNGERLGIPPNVRIMFEVQDLKYATLATVSRCGMVWFSEDVLAVDMVFENYLRRLKAVPLDESEEEHKAPSALKTSEGGQNNPSEAETSMALNIQRDCANTLQPYFQPNGLVSKCLEFGKTLEHIMDYTKLRSLGTLFCMMNQVIRNLITYNQNHPDFPIQQDQLEKYTSKSLINAILWSIAGDGKLKIRMELCEYVRGITTIPLPPANSPIIDYEVSIEGEWVMWTNKVPQVEVETHKVASPDVVIPTIDTVRHEALLSAWLYEHKPMVLCGPPGSGKTMTLFSALRAMPELEVVGLNFSSATNPELMLKTFDHYCEYRKTPNGLVLSPLQLNKWLVLFCDEINLPDMDKYGTQRIISFLRQMVEHGGFYRASDQAWVKFERIQFVGACNPPTDPGRKPLSHRFLRHVPVVYVDYPGKVSLCQIYGTFNRAMLRLIPTLKTYAEPLTNAMVELYLLSQTKFTHDLQPHYIYSPREMTRWVRGICEALRPLETLSVEGLVRIWAHEALRLFQDRLIEDDERLWTNEQIDSIALKHFPNINKETALKRPILYSNWLSKDYMPVEQEELREHVKARLKVFYEEELDVPLVLFDEVLDHVLRIDRIFRQPQGHLLLIGVSGSGKTTLSRFVAWMNGLSIFQVKVHNKYTAEDFDEDLRHCLRRSGCRGDKICFIMDESNVLDSSFLERMNTLLANGEVPGLFEGDEMTTLMTQCKEGAQKEGLMIDTQEELYKWFTQQVMYNLHVVFTMNPSSEGLKDRASTSPALFNRCVLNWFGDWSNTAYYQVGKEFTNKIDLEKPSYVVPSNVVGLPENISSPTTHREAVISTMVFVHQTLHQANQKVAKRGGRTTAITPRHYLDFINHYVKLYNEKRSDLEEQQLHLNIGLQKIRETVEQVEELQKSLSVKRNELEEKNNLANNKLKQMVKDQQEAERKKQTSMEIQVALEKQTEVIRVKKEDVMSDLSKVEPAVRDAQQAVKGIRKQNLVEVRSLPSPPPAVKLALEGICTLLGEKDTDWKSMRQVMMRDNFISTIINFNTEDITPEIRQKMAKFVNNPDYNYEKINRASIACGPMVKWSLAQIMYSEMLNKIDPLKKELNSLEVEADTNRKKAQEMQELVTQLEKSITQYKEEYALLISQAQAIKADLESVEIKVGRSVALLESLTGERGRWEQGSESFKSQMSTIIGDVLVMSAFMAYAGYYDQHMRQNLFLTWCHHMQDCNIQFKPEIARIEYLSNADDRLKWQACSLPSDDLCTENAIMLNRFNRYPLIIDPSGQATEFIQAFYKDKKITKTSFLDDAFRKNLESALRFGNPLLVQDVESYDPVLNPVLNRELRRTGGRVLITLGDQDIDLSPTFTIFLSTRDPTVEFPPDLCSRVTFVNFTVTRSSLQSQCLNKVLKAERPDVDSKRSDLLKLQGEFLLRLRHLEKSLLVSLNETKGRILDDDSIITNLEKLKKEAKEIATRVEETDATIMEVERTSQQYSALALACSSIYFTLEALHQVHFLYQYSLQFFLEIFSCVLSSKTLQGNTDYTSRLNIIIKQLFEVTFTRVSRGMMHQDRSTFAVLLARIRMKLDSVPQYESEFTHLMRGQEGLLKESLPAISWLNDPQKQALVRLQKLSFFKNVKDNINDKESEVRQWMEVVMAEQDVPTLWDADKPLDPVGEAVHKMLMMQALRPDRLLAAVHHFICAVFNTSFLNDAEKELDLADLVENELKANTPVLMCAVAGFDASGRVDDLAHDLNKQITSIAIGSAEGFSQADKTINSAIKSGKWVMLKNVHLAPQWLVQLEKKLHSLTPHPGFRLFLTMEINPKLPVNLLRAGRILVYEPPPGIRANMLRTFSTIPASRMTKAPLERCRLYFLLAWFHAVVQERLTYAPLGWSKRYEFNESDIKCACDTIDTWIDSAAMGRTNIAPEKVPWDAFRTLLAQCIYGGKIDNQFDQRLLTAFVNKLFTEKAFDSKFTLVAAVDGNKAANICMPDGVKREDFISFVESLGDKQTPSWLGLPNNAEKVLLTSQGVEMINKMLKMQMLEDDDELAYSSGDKNVQQKEQDGRPAWMKTLSNSLLTWSQMLPKALSPLKRTAENIKDPLFRFFEREVNVVIKLLADVRKDMEDALKICSGEKKPTNHHRALIADLAKGLIPSTWRRYTIPVAITVIQWISDFSARVKQMHSISTQALQDGPPALKNFHLWLGGLMIPEAYITATRQYVAQANSWSLEEISLQVVVYDKHQSIQLDSCSFGVTGLKLQGALCENNALQLSSKISTDLPVVTLKWVRTDENPVSESKINLPVYLNASRAQLLFTVDFEATGEGSGKDHSFYERGVALIASALGSA